MAATRPRRRRPAPRLTLDALAVADRIAARLLESLPSFVAAWEAAQQAAHAERQQARVNSRAEQSHVKPLNPDSPGLLQLRADLAAGAARAADFADAAHGVPCTQRPAWRAAHGLPPLATLPDNGRPPLATHGSTRRPDGTSIPRSRED